MFGKKPDKFLMQISVDLGNGMNSGMSVNLPVGTNLEAMNDTFDIMRRVLDRQRAMCELPVFTEKLELLEAQIQTTREAIVKYQAEADAESKKTGGPKTATANAVENNQQNLERMLADYEIGQRRVANIQRRIDATEDDDPAEINRLGTAA